MVMQCLESSDGGELLRYKVVIIGDSNVGKTCIVNRIINDVFMATESNVGALFFSKDVTINAENMLKPVKIRL